MISLISICQTVLKGFCMKMVRMHALQIAGGHTWVETKVVQKLMFSFSVLHPQN